MAVAPELVMVTLAPKPAPQSLVTLYFTVQPLPAEAGLVGPVVGLGEDRVGETDGLGAAEVGETDGVGDGETGVPLGTLPQTTVLPSDRVMSGSSTGVAPGVAGRPWNDQSRV